MTIGSMFNGTCYPTQAQAATAACASWLAYAPDGSFSRCTGLGTTNVSSTTDGGTRFSGLSITSFPAPGSGLSASTTERVVVVQACERYDYEYWSPVVGAWVAALVAILAARVLYTRVFNRETL